MYLGYNIGLVGTWLLFPLIRWRPFTRLSIVTTVAVLLLALLLVQLPIFSWLKLPNDDYGIYAFTLTFSFYAISLFELATRFIIKRPGDPASA
jgi:hypothetical protein